MLHLHLNDMEIPETKRFIPKGFELVQHLVSQIGLFGERQVRSTLCHPYYDGILKFRKPNRKQYIVR